MKLSPSSPPNKDNPEKTSYSKVDIIIGLLIFSVALTVFFSVSLIDCRSRIIKATENKTVLEKQWQTILDENPTPWSENMPETDRDSINTVSSGLKEVSFIISDLEVDIKRYRVCRFASSLFAILFTVSLLLCKKKTIGKSLLASRSSTIDNNKLYEDALSQFNACKDPLKKIILGNFCAHQIQEYLTHSLHPQLVKVQNKAKRKPTVENSAQIEKLRSEVKKLEDMVSSMTYNIDSVLSKEEIDVYQRFSEAFSNLQKCHAIWQIQSSKPNNEYKTFASTLVNRKRALLKGGSFPTLESRFIVPVFYTNQGIPTYFYPRFIINGEDIHSFNVIPINDVQLLCNKTRFIEEDNRPSDATKVDTTYKYVNKNGGPDRRYSYNPIIPILLYGDLTIRSLDIHYQFSNYCAAKCFCDLFYSLKNVSATIQDAHISFDNCNKGLDNRGASSLISSTNQVERESSQITNDEPKPQNAPLSSLLNPALQTINDDSLSPQTARLYKAARLVVISQWSSTASLMRQMGLNYSQITQILNQLEMLRIVGPQNGSMPREVLVPSIDQLDYIFKIYSAAEDQDMTDEEYFNDVLVAAKRLIDFEKKLSSNNSFCEKTGEIVNGTVNWNGKIVTNTKEKLPAFLWSDVIQCYSGLGHGLDLKKKEGLGIVMFNTLMIKPDFPFDYRFLSIIQGDLTKSAEAFTRTTLSTIKKDQDVFLLEYCLREFDTELHNQYVILLYRFANLVSKVDKHVSEEETRWLSHIMSLIIPEKSDAIITDIPQDDFSVITIKKKNLKSKASKELNSLIGLTSVKAEIQTLSNYLKIQKMREEKGMKIPPISYHCVFTGNPGTGKTTVARIVAQIYKELGILKKGHLIETDRSGLVAEYVGQTAVKTNKIIDSALDGVLFIDEAYSLIDGGQEDYGKEAIATLLKRMEDDRDRLVIILAGYTDDMQRFIDSNPGLHSRFNRYIEFPDFSADELYQIFCSCAKKYEYTIVEEAEPVLRGIFEKALATKDKSFGNGRFVRNLFERAIERQADRLSAEANVTAEALASIKVEDIIH